MIYEPKIDADKEKELPILIRIIDIELSDEVVVSEKVRKRIPFVHFAQFALLLVYILGRFMCVVLRYAYQ